METGELGVLAIGEATTFTTYGLAFIAIIGTLALILPWRLAPLPIFFACCFITIGQQLVVVGLNFTVIRIVMLILWVRLIIRREYHAIGFNTIDKAFIIWLFVGLVAYSVFLVGTEDALVNRLGHVYNAALTYFFFRIYFKEIGDIDRAIRLLALTTAPLALLMIFEGITGRNMFSIFGGVPEISWVREGSVRAQGPFRSAIIAGTFGATLVPLFACIWWQDNKGKAVASIGIGSCILIVVAAHSGGPVSALLFGGIAFFFWYFRPQIKMVLWIALLCFVWAALFMQAPVWYLMVRISDLTGGGGWHRAYLIDQALAHLDEWWLVGTTYTAHWMPYALTIEPDMVDITNQFLNEGVNGGLITMFLFTLVVVYAALGIRKGYLAMQERPIQVQLILWSIGASFVTHIITFMSISYFDQMIVYWYMTLAMAAWAHNVTEAVEDESDELLEPDAADYYNGVRVG